jgi:DNA-binding LacI/PurR family transcriptional regulator
MHRALRSAGIEHEATLEQRGPHGREEARELAEQLLRLPTPPTAIFAASDVQAMGVLEAARAMGRRVPEDLAVIGFDDIEVAAALELTTVRQPLRETGRRGADLLIAAIQGIEAPRAEELAPLAVIQRGTT